MTAAQHSGEAGARQGEPWLAAMEVVGADPERLVRVVRAADTREEAMHAVATEFALTVEQATVVLEQQVGGLVGSSREAITQELRVLRAPWGEPVELQLRASSRRSAVLALDGQEHHFRATGRDALQQQVSQFLLDHLARPRLRPVLVTTDLVGGPSLMTIWPSGTVEFSYPEGDGGSEGVPTVAQG
jgi:hypothetical protein